MNHLISKEEIENYAGLDLDYEIFNRVAEFIDKSQSNKIFETISSLPVGYQVLYSTTVVEGELFNGGFYQYFGNSTAEEFNELAIESFAKIGAIKTSALLKEVFNKILDQSPVFKAKYQSSGIQSAFNEANDEHNEIKIEEYDEIFGKISEQEDYKNLRLNYIKNNLNDF